jgi:hypothetical protein
MTRRKAPSSAWPWIVGSCLLVPQALFAETDGKVILTAKSTTVPVGKEVAVDVVVEGAPEIYGADVQIVFDPKVVEVVDADEKAPGVQLRSGDFIEPKKSFYLQHNANNETGVIDYALTLMNPAPAVAGNGRLAEIVFRGKAGGTAQLSVKQAQFGTRTGRVLNPDRGSLRLLVTTGKVDATVRPALEAVRQAVERVKEVVNPPSGRQPWVYVIAGAFFGIVLGWVVSRRMSRKRPDTR